MKLGILLTSGPFSPDAHTAIQLARAALEQNIEVEMFLMMDAVYHVNGDRLDGMIKSGVKITLCAHNAGERGVPQREGYNFGSQYDLAQLTAKADKMITL
ncbi:MAG: DsrE family protein [Nitrospinae bacterium]|nr:DsrE family protein [Nitrospinota bacterium]